MLICDPFVIDSEICKLSNPRAKIGIGRTVSTRIKELIEVTTSILRIGSITLKAT